MSLKNFLEIDSSDNVSTSEYYQKNQNENTDLEIEKNNNVNIMSNVRLTKKQIIENALACVMDVNKGFKYFQKSLQSMLKIFFIE